ncbi:ATP-dependent helicase [Candidatus Deferrimicrobium sp.]|uniref:ATP-dependent helicase n=1 Tax=Candidatus Deferrimicrobium sp. TaxID=3060586 RepID=UPI002ED7BE33
MLSDPIFTTLDPDQRRAVLHDGGPLLLVAGAGSGKTRAIVARIVRLLRDGVPARSILGITFTNRAAGEMRERVAKALVPGGEPSAGDTAARSFRWGSGRTEVPWLGTFHAFGAILLRRHGDRIGLSPRFVIYDTRDQHDALKRILKDLNVDEKKFPPAKFGWLIERAKRDGVSVEQAALSAGWRVVTTAGQVGKAYDEALAEAGAVDFTDLIRLPVTLLRGAPDVLSAVRSEVRHLLVDEFQDIDGAQEELTELIARGADSFCAVGDEDQSIYGWRGASAAPMLSFEGRHPGAKVIHLSTNYRSRAAILSVAGALIAKNRSRREKKITPAREGGERPAMAVYADQEAEALEVASAAAREIRAGVAPPEIAVFYRVNAQSRAIEDALRMLRIPYVLRGALSFYERAAVRDAVSYLKWFLHPDDAVSLKRLLKFPRRGVGEVTLEKARAAARREGIPPSGALARIPHLAPLFSFRALWLAELPQMSPAEALHSLLSGTGFLDALEASARGPGEGREGAGREEDLEHVRELLRVAEAFTGAGEEGLLEFLEKVTLAAEETGGEESEAVRLMTLHNAKGLEFDVVFLVGLEDGLLPHSRSVDSPQEIEEERRLFYVGLTRARERVFLSLVRRRNLFGSYRDAVPSRFLYDLPAALVRRTDVAPPESSRPGRGSFGGSGPGHRVTVTREPRYEEENPSARPRKVRHPVFGEGKVESVQGEGEDRKIIARFPVYGLKKILVRAVVMEFLD